MARYFTSDLHYGHNMVSGLRGFETVEEHNAHLTEMWDRTVKKHDSVYVLGDLSMNPNNGVIEWISERPGSKTLVFGNHDMGPWSSRFRRYFREYFKAFEAFGDTGQVKLGDQKVLLSHFPYDGDHTEEDRLTQFRLRDEGRPLLFGHLHSAQKEYTSSKGTRMLHVGLDAWGLEFVHEDRIIEWLNA